MQTSRAHSTTSTGGSDRTPENGTLGIVNGKRHVFYEGYWIRYYPPPPDTWTGKKLLIEQLTRRLFHHTEWGINTPGPRLEEARRAYRRERDPRRRRVNAAMLAGALFNRAAAIFTSIAELAEKGVRVRPDNELLQQCEQAFREALELGKSVKHYSGEEGIDELWGEPLNVFVLPMREFYATRYMKIALCKRDIDHIGATMCATIAAQPAFSGTSSLIRELCESAKEEAETQRSDPATFNVWPRFVAAGEALTEFVPSLPPDAGAAHRRLARRGVALLAEGRDIIGWITSARVPMQKTMQRYLRRLHRFATGESEEPD